MTFTLSVVFTRASNSDRSVSRCRMPVVATSVTPRTIASADVAMSRPGITDFTPSDTPASIVLARFAVDFAASTRPLSADEPAFAAFSPSYGSLFSHDDLIDPAIAIALSTAPIRLFTTLVIDEMPEAAFVSSDFGASFLSFQSRWLRPSWMCAFLPTGFSWNCV